MTNETLKKRIHKEQNRTFTAKDFESARSQLLDIGRTYFPDKIQDFSEASVGGMLLDFSATVMDALSFYLDHSFRELDPQTATEPDVIVGHLRNANVEIVGAAPSTAGLQFSFVVPAENVNGVFLPKLSALPTILAGTVCTSLGGITFNTTEDLDFSEKDQDGNFVAEFSVLAVNVDGSPATFKMQRSVTAVSGQEATQTFNIDDNFVPFREITMLESSISTILSVSDTDGNTYYEVSSLSDDTAFQKVKNMSADKSQVSNYIRVIATPRRFVRRYDPITQLTTLRFGSGDAETLDDDIVPDPSDLSLPLFGKNIVPKFSIDPSAMLRTSTLGISPRGTTINVRYRRGGGISHNVAKGTIVTVTNLSVQFQRSPNADDALIVRRSISVINPYAAAGGDSAPTLEELKSKIAPARKSQMRIVTRQDLLARLYSLPAQFGRVYRAGVSDNPANPQSAILYILSKDSVGRLVVSPDTLKQNIRTYLNEFRLVGDALDICDAKIYNFGVKYSVYVAENANKSQVIVNVNQRIANALDRKFFNINQPLIIDDITYVIINSDFVVSIIDLQIFPRFGAVEGREYSGSTFDFKQSATKGIIRGEQGSIFELRYPDFDIVGNAF